MNSKQFFDSLYRYCDGVIETRALPSQRRFFCEGMEHITNFCDQNKDQNLFFGIGTRDGNGGGKSNLVEIPCLWCDCDFKDTPKEKLYENLRAFPYKPTMMVQSGGGFHLYWLLKEPATQEDIPILEDANHRIATALGGDLNACDAARILRIPETKNIKYDPPRDCEVVRNFDDLEYEITDFIDVLDPVQTPCLQPANDEEKDPNWLITAMSGVGNGNRNSTGAKIAGYWINKVSKRDVITILKTWNTNNTPPLSDQEIYTIANSVSRYEPDKKSENKKVSIDNVYTPQRMLQSYQEYVKTLKQNRFITGIHEIDKKIRGVAGGEVLTIIARSGAFKTTALQNMLKNYVNNSAWGSIFFSIEMPVANLTERFLQQFDSSTGREIEEYYSGGHSDFYKPIEQRFLKSLNKLFVIPNRVSLSDISEYKQLIESHYNLKIGVIGVDYMGLIDQQGQNEYAIMSEIAKNTKVLAKELNIPIVMLCQTSRQGGQGTSELDMTAARGSGAIEEAADFLLGMWKEYVPVEDAITRLVVDKKPELICKILKNRKGPEGGKWKLQLSPEYFQIGSDAELIVEDEKKNGSGY